MYSSDDLLLDPDELGTNLKLRGIATEATKASEGSGGTEGAEAIATATAMAELGTEMKRVNAVIKAGKYSRHTDIEIKLDERILQWAKVGTANNTISRNLLIYTRF